jgi:hypothetical protein
MKNTVEKKRLIVVLGLLMLLIYACGDKFDYSFDKLSTNIETTSEIIVPLIDAEVTIEELLPETSETSRYLEIGTDNFIKLIYEDTISTITAPEMFGAQLSGIDLPGYTHVADPETVTLKLDNLLNNGRIYFADPKMIISIKNYWDFDANFRFNEFFYYPHEGDGGIAVTGSAITGLYSINRPGVEGYSITNIELNRTNSNIDEVLSALPYSISAGATIEIPPSTGEYEIDGTTVDTVKLKVEMPLDLLIDDIVYSDTMDFTLFNEYEEDANDIEFLNFNLRSVNGFPVDLLTQIYFADDNGLIIDSISSTGIDILAGNSKDGNNNPLTTENIIELDRSKITSATRATKLILKVAINSRNASLDETVKLYSSYSVGLQAAVRTRLKLKIN